MMLDVKLTQLALKIRKLVLVDVSFPQSHFKEFRQSHEPRYVHLPGRQGMALEYAAGLASLGKIVLVYGGEADELLPLDATLNVKQLRFDEAASWEDLEQQVVAFGPGVVLIPAQA